MAFEYNSQIIINRRLGNSDSPYVPITESLIVDPNGKAILTELPFEIDKVIVSGDNKIWFEITKGVPQDNEFLVDYKGGKTVTFNISNVGKQLAFEYKGMGNHYIPASMVYISEQNGDVTATLDSITQDAATAINNVTQTNTNIQSAEDIRVLNETTRQTQETTRQSNTTTAINTLNSAVDSTKINWLSPLATYASIATTYPSPVNGDTVQVENDIPNNGTYRFNGTTWVKIQNPNGYANTSEIIMKNSVVTEVFTSTDNQSIFTLTNTYDINNDLIEVIVGGVPQYDGNFIKTNSNTITLSEGVSVGISVRIKYVKTN